MLTKTASVVEGLKKRVYNTALLGRGELCRAAINFRSTEYPVMIIGVHVNLLRLDTFITRSTLFRLIFFG
jgi:hypothetical protein